MKTSEITDKIEEFCPTQYAESWDNVGLLVGSKEKTVNKVMIALDATKKVIVQAIEAEVDMLITHHPMIFSPIKKVVSENFIGDKIIELVKHDISYYAMHTNFDIMGMAEESANKIGLINTKPLQVSMCNISALEVANEGIGRVGELKEETTLIQLANQVKKAFGIDYVRVVGDKSITVKKVAICTGAGKSMMEQVKSNNVDVFITGDMDHHTVLDALEEGICIIDAGHFGTESFMKEYVGKYLENRTNVKVFIAKEEDPFQIV